MPLFDDLMSRERQHQTIVGVVALIIWIAVLLSMSDFPSRAATFPRFVLISLVVFSVLHILTQIAGAYSDRPRGTQPEPEPADTPAALGDDAPIEVIETRGGLIESRGLRAVVFTVGVVIYVVVMPELGYLISTWLFVIGAALMVVGFRVKVIATCCIAVLVLWIVATQLLEVRLPAGLII
jgi:hypothetical protein